MTLSDIHLSFLRRAAESAVSADMDVAIGPNILMALLDEIGLHRATCYLAEPSNKLSVLPAHRVSACVAEGCDRPVTGLSLYCKKHKMRVARHGDPSVKLPPWGRKRGTNDR